MLMLMSGRALVDTAFVGEAPTRTIVYHEIPLPPRASPPVRSELLVFSVSTAHTPTRWPLSSQVPPTTELFRLHTYQAITASEHPNNPTSNQLTQLCRWIPISLVNRHPNPPF
ncbi:hypothetical protein CGCF413_v012231 [Colletotrichum fructicola]|nr:hypothetical protein CGCF413_v012231 [Colletotrichum fructicola]